MNGSTIKTVAELVQWFSTLNRELVSADTETTSLKQAELECLGLSLCDGKQSCYIDLLDGDQYSGLLEVLKAEIPRIQRVIMHGAPFDMRVLSKLGVGHTEDIVCTMTAAFLLDENGGVGLKELAVRYLGVQPSDAISWKVASVGGFKSETFYSYGRRDAEWTWALWRLLDARLEEAGLYPLFYDIEMPFQFVLRDLEINGVFIDQGALSTLRASLNEEAGKLQLDTYRAGGINCVSETNLLGEVSHRPEVNIDSPLQLSDFIVNRLGIDIAALSESGTSVDKHVLGQLENKHEFFRCLLAYRTANKLKTMFLDKAPSFVDSDGRIRASFNNCIAHTGRLTSSNPNLQQLPKKGTKHGSVRSLIIAPPGYTLIAADYCFSKDTEVLTEAGWKAFPSLTGNDKVAQYSDGAITYATPTARQVLPYKGDLVWIHGSRQVDICVTPEHQCLLLDGHSRRPFKVRADEYPAHHIQPQSGIAGGGIDGTPFMQVAVAIQADGSAQGNRWCCWFNKPRKVERLKSLLSQTDLQWQLQTCAKKAAGTNIVIPNDDRILKYMDRDTKTFCRESILGMSPEWRTRFLQEVLAWDGSGNVYYSTNLANCNTVQECAVLTGWRANIRIVERPGHKPCGLVQLSSRGFTYTKTLSKELIPYDDLVYCVTMPHGTVVIRRNGRVSITGQCGQELRVLAEVSRDLTMIAAFILGQDLHLTMANKFFGLGIPEPLLYEQHPQHKEVRSKYKNERDKSKTINFGIAYGKAQPLTTPIPAPRGWTTMGQLHIGTEVFAADGTVTTVTGVYPQGVRPVYKITMQDGSSTLCDEEHLWEIQTTYDRKLGRSRVLRTIDIVPVLMKGTQHNCSIRRCDPLRYHAQKQPIPPYLMGLYIGDGWCNGSIGLCLPVDSTRQEVERLLLPNHTLVHAGRYNYRITAPHKRNARGQYTNQNYYLNVIRELGLGECQSYTKFIPSQYLHGSVEQRQELWRGLLDSDGADNHNSYEYSTSSPQLAKDVQELVRSLGGRCTISTRVPTYQYGEGRVSYRLMISFPPYSQTNCIESIVYVGDMPCQCVSVAHESQLYVTEDYLVTHNTAQGFSQDWNISRAEAEGVVARYFEAAPRVRDAIEECKCFLNSHGYVVNLAGRYRHLPVGNNRSYRQAFNFLIQGFSADLVKLASVKVRRLCLLHPEWDCHIVLQVHDELVYEIKTEYVNEALPLIKYTMEHVWSLSVPMVVDIQTGQNYQECK